MLKLKYLPLLQEYKSKSLLRNKQKSNYTNIFSSNKTLIVAGSVALVSLLWANDALAATAGLEENLEKVRKFATGKMAGTGFAVVTVIVGIRAIFSGAYPLAIASIGIGIATVFYLDYIQKAFGVG